MADFLENILRAMKLVPERVDSSAAVADLDESLQAPPQMDRYLQGFRQGLLGNKAEYEQAQKVFIDPNSTEDQRQSAQQAMNQAHDRADYTRDLAKRMGYNLDNYGAKTSLDEATKNYQADTNSAIRQLLNQDMTSEQYYDEAYRRLHEAGLPMRQAQQEAARRANLYKAQRLAKYSTAMQMYGQDGGLMNEYAPMFMNMIARDMEDPQTAVANVLSNMYISPDKQYESAQNQKARDDALENNLKQLATQHGYNLDTLLQKFDLNEKAADNALSRSKDLYGYQKNTDYNYGEKKAESASRRAIREYAEKRKIDIKNATEEQMASLGNLHNALVKYGIKPGTEAYYSAMFGIKPTAIKNDGSKAANDEIENYKKLSDMLNGQINALSTQYKNLAEDDPKHSEIQVMLDRYQTYYQQINDTIFGSEENSGLQLTGDWNQDGATIQAETQRLQKLDYSDDQIDLIIFMNALIAGASLDYALGAVGENLEKLESIARSEGKTEAFNQLVKSRSN